MLGPGRTIRTLYHNYSYGKSLTEVMVRPSGAPTGAAMYDCLGRMRPVVAMDNRLSSLGFGVKVALETAFYA